MSSVVIAGDTSGTVTLQAPAVAGSTTLTLPATSGTVQLSGEAVTGTTGSFTGNLSFNSGYGSSATAYGCRAWVNFNGTGTVDIRASGNVSSITDNGTGDYTVNFTTAMPDINYSVSGCYSDSGNTAFVIASATSGGAPTTMTVSAIRVKNVTGDINTCCVNINR